MGKVVEDKLDSLIEEQSGISRAPLPARFYGDLSDGDLGFDSLDCIELVIAIEQDFSIEIPDEDMDSIRTVQDAIAYIESKLDPTEK